MMKKYTSEMYKIYWVGLKKNWDVKSNFSSFCEAYLVSYD